MGEHEGGAPAAADGADVKDQCVAKTTPRDAWLAGTGADYRCTRRAVEGDMCKQHAQRRERLREELETIVRRHGYALGAGAREFRTVLGALDALRGKP